MDKQIKKILDSMRATVISANIVKFVQLRRELEGLVEGYG